MQFDNHKLHQINCHNMSSRKSSLRFDQTIDLIDIRNLNIQQSRQRKNSVGFTRTGMQPINCAANNITLDEKLTVKLLFAKKLQKLQKQAIKHFYDHKPEECFLTLQKCENLLQQRNFLHNEQSNDTNFPEHMIYIRYLQSQFKYKLKLFEQSREFYEKAAKIINKLTKNEKQKSKEYLASLEALNACLLFEEGRFAQSIKVVDQVMGKIQDGVYRLNDKTLKQLILCKIQSLIQLNKFSQAITLITKFTSQQKSLSNRETYKTSTTLALCHKNLQNELYAQQILQNLIQHFKQKLQCEGIQQCNETFNEIQSYISKAYSFYADLIQNDALKCIYVCKKWRKDCQFCDLATVRLFKLYYHIGDYQAALVQFSELSEEYRRSSQDWEFLAQIKKFYGENQTAQHMYTKALELTKSQQQKLKIQIKLLQFCSDLQRKQAMKGVEKKIKDNRAKKWAEKSVQLYGEYLITIGQQQRLQKITKLIPIGPNLAGQAISKPNINSYDEMMQTGKFGAASSALKQQDSNILQSRIKKGSTRLEKNK